MDDLTKEQHHFITSLYKEFLCRQPALPSDKARVFSDASFIQENIFPEYSLDKICFIVLFTEKCRLSILYELRQHCL